MKGFFSIVVASFTSLNSFAQVNSFPDLIQSATLRKDTLRNCVKIRFSCGMTRNFTDTPIYFIDGTPVEYKQLGKLNPNDIVSIDVLKESATGIISCRAPQGVVVIVTKQSFMKRLQVKDLQTNEGIPGATITFKMKNTAETKIISVNERGIIDFNIQNQNYDSVIVSSVGYQNFETSYDVFKRQGYKFYLKQQVKPLREVTVIGYSKRTTRCGMIISKSYVSDNSDCTVFSKTSIKLFPNPVSTSGTIQLSFGSLKSGMYQLRLLNASGQLFYSFQKQISSPNQTEQIHLHERMSAGVYTLQVLDEKKKLVQTNKVVVQ
jgi:hypothetical protein